MDVGQGLTLGDFPFPDQARQGSTAEPSSHTPSPVTLRASEKTTVSKVFLFQAVCGIHSKIVQEVISKDELKYRVSQFDISQVLLF